MLQKILRKRWKKWFCLLLILAGIAFLWWFETFCLTATEVTICDEKIKDEITIVQLTDLHGTLFGKNNQALLNKIDQYHPSIIVVTGDMYTAGDTTGQRVALQLLNDLAQKYTVLFVNGEHDNKAAFQEQLSDVGVQVLDYKTYRFTINETELCFYGINNVYFSPTFDLTHVFTLQKHCYNILLAHICNEKAYTAFGVNLALCGDTHGGQVRLPLLGAVFDGEDWLPENLHGKLLKGLYAKGETWLFISSGLGNYPLPVRLFNRPEIAVIYLKPSL